MNNVTLIGRLTRDVELRYTPSQKAVARFTLAIDRPTFQGEEKQADFPSCTVWGRTAENMEKYTRKGSKVAVEGRIQTGSYEKNGQTIYTTEVLANRVEFLDPRSDVSAPTPVRQQDMEMPDDFKAIDEDVPF